MRNKASPGEPPVRHRHLSKPHIQSERGQALVEFALVLPVLLLLLLLAIDFGRLFMTYVAVNNAAREATNYAAAHAADSPFDLTAYNDAAMSAAARETNVQAQGGEGAMSVSQPVCFAPGSGAVLDCSTASNFATGIGNQVTVSVQQPFSFLTPLVGSLVGGQLSLDASATASVLNPADVTILRDPEATPTPTPTPAPTPTPSLTPTPDPGATPTPTPVATPTPTPSPVPTCTVPNFKNTFWNNPDALNTWHNVAGFTGVLTDQTDDKKIENQTIKKKSVVLCSSNMTVSD